MSLRRPRREFPVFDAAVIGVPDLEMGESVTAVIQAAEQAGPGPEPADELRTLLRDRYVQSGSAPARRPDKVS